MWRWARSLWSQKVGAPISASIASISRSFCSPSKKPPQVAGALLDVLDVVEGLRGNHTGEEAGNRAGRKAQARIPPARAARQARGPP
jgi:hypothetical protein